MTQLEDGTERSTGDMIEFLEQIFIAKVTGLEENTERKSSDGCFMEKLITGAQWCKTDSLVYK